MRHLLILKLNFGKRSVGYMLHLLFVVVMFDLSPNHMGYPTAKIGMEKFNPFNNMTYFHDYTQWSDKGYFKTMKDPDAIVNSWIYGLPDINTEDPYVVGVLATWLRFMKKEYKFDGLRVGDVSNIHYCCSRFLATC